MASHRRPKPVSRTRISFLTAAAVTAVALTSSAGAQADPTPTRDQVKAQVDQLNQQAEVATENLDAATEKQQRLQQQVGDLQDQIAREQAKVTDTETGLAEVAAEQYRDGGISPTVQLMLTSDPGSFLNKAGAMNQLGAQQRDALKALQAEQRQLDQQKNEAQAKLADLDTTAKSLKTAKDDVQAKLQKAQSLLDSLTQQQREQLAAADAQSAASSRDAARTAITIAAPNAHAAAAIAAAESKLDSPYVYGATGPGSFDCSGLMQWAYAQAGVSLPRTSQEQASAGTNIGTDIANAQPGDLIIYYSAESHVGMYVGSNLIVHAPHTGAVVRYESATVMPIAAIVRI